MLILLPPSETKARGGEGEPLSLAALSFPALNPIRRTIAADLAGLDADAALAVLGISPKLREEAQANARLFESPTMPALERYTGVLYDALSPASLPPAARDRLAVASALFGLVRAHDPIPHYRLSAGTKLPDRAGGRPTMKARWGAAISEELHKLGAEDLIIDLRSGAYQGLGKARAAVTVRVESERPDGSRAVVSHFNKRYKGELARLLALSPVEAYSLADVAAIARAGGLQVDAPAAGSTQLTLVVPRGEGGPR